MKNAIVTTLILTAGSLLYAQEPAAVPAAMEEPAKVIVTITENGETYTIELPSLESLADMEDLKGLETLQYLEGLEDEDLEFDTFLAEVQADTLDSTSVTIGKWKVVVKEKGDGTDDVDVKFDRVEDDDVKDIDTYRDVFETDWFLFDLGYNTYVDKDMQFVKLMADSIALDQKSWGSWDVNLHIFRQRLNIAQGFVNLNWGLSFEWHNYMFRGNYYPTPQQSVFTLQESASTTNLEKNRFSSTHFTLPVMLGFETKPWDTDHSFRMGFGYSPGLMVKGKTKIKDDRGTNKVKDDFNLESPFRHEVNVMMGYGGFNLYASYDLNSMFAEGEGPELHPVSVGLIIRRGFDN